MKKLKTKKPVTIPAASEKVYADLHIHRVALTNDNEGNQLLRVATCPCREVDGKAELLPGSDCVVVIKDLDAVVEANPGGAVAAFLDAAADLVEHLENNEPSE
jgi:hypothetical protein